MKKIRIAFVETNCKKNGPIKQTLNIIRYMDRNIFEPALITVWPEDENNSMIDEYKALGITCYCAGLTRKESLFKGKKAVAAFLNEFDADIVHGVGMPLYRMSLGYKEAVHLTTLRNYCYEDYPAKYGKIIGPILAYKDIKLIKKRIKTENTFVTCSDSLKKMYKERQNFDLLCISNGVNVEQYLKMEMTSKDQIRKKLNLPPDKFIFVYTGSFIDRKNQIEAIRAFQNMKYREKTVLLLLGDGKDFANLKESCSEDQDIIFAGKVSNVNEYLNASDVYLSTSKSEGLPNGVLEAMACRLPVLLSDINQHTEILENDSICGYSYRLGDEKELSEKMDLIVNDNINEMGEHSYKVVMNHFTAEGMSKKYQEFYQNLMKKQF